MFSVEKHRDETELMDKNGAIDFNSHQDVFYSLYSKVKTSTLHDAQRLINTGEVGSVN